MTDLAIQTSSVPGATATVSKAAGGGDFSDFLNTLVDIVNPLQHLPVISTLYRSLTGDTINAPARVVGGALFGGPLGAAGALVNLIIEDATGHDIGDHALALLSDDGDGAGEQLASLDGVGPAASRGEPVMVAYGDVNAMMPDAVAWNGKWHRPGPPSAPQAVQQARAVEEPAPSSAGAGVASPLPQAKPAPQAEPAPQRDAAVAATRAPIDVPPAPPAPPAKPVTDAGASPPPAAPAWLAAALAQAEQGREMTAAGRDPAPHAAPRSISSAMSHALDKYQAMAIARNLQPTEAGNAAAQDD